jgi:hypothetical protein
MRHRDEKSRRETLSPLSLALAAALAIFVFIVTLPESPPFGVGQGFGRGFLLGAIGGVVAMLVIARAAIPLVSLLVSQFAALVVVALPLLFLRATIIDSLLGVACGWLAVTLILVQGASTPALLLSGASGAGFTVTLCAVSALGVYRDFLTPEIARGTWSSLAVAFAAGVPVAVLFSEQLGVQLLREQVQKKSVLLSAFFAVVLLLLFANLLAFKIISQPRFSMVVAAGLLAGCLMWWAARVENNNDTINANHSVACTPLIPLGGFVMLGAVVCSFGMLQGFGIGLMLLAAWSILGLAQQESVGRSTLQTTQVVSERLLHGFLFGAILLVERLFEQRFRADLRGVAITDYYALLGFLIGASLPTLLASWLRPSRTASTLWARLVIIGIAVLTVPALLMIVWGVKTSFALLFGLALACLISRNGAREMSLNASLLAMAIALLIAQWTHRLLPLSEMTRNERLRALGIVLLFLLIFVIAEELAARLAKKRDVQIEVIVS